jgi:putative ABC transport system permease protein
MGEGCLVQGRVSLNSHTLIWGALKRRKARSIFTFLSVVVAFMLFCILVSVRQGMLGQLKISSAERLITYNKVSRGNPMPLSYYAKIITVPGVTTAIYLNTFGGYYKDDKNSFRVFFTNAHEVKKVYQEFKLPPAQWQAWFDDQQGVIAGPSLVRRMGWKIGDTIPVQSKIPQKDGSTTWYFHLCGIYQTDLPTAYQNYFVAHYQYINQSVADPQYQNVVGEYTERIDDPRNSTAIADAIDKLFENSSPQTLTQTQVAATVSYIRQFGDVSAMVIYVGIAVFFSMLLIIGNTMAQSVRERTTEFAMLRALGFTRAWLLWLVMRESMLLIVSAGLLGIILGYAVTQLLAPEVRNILQTFGMTWSTTGLGIALSIIFGLLAALVPMQWISRLHVAEALRKT